MPKDVCHVIVSYNQVGIFQSREVVLSELKGKKNIGIFTLGNYIAFIVTNPKNTAEDVLLLYCNTTFRLLQEVKMNCRIQYLRCMHLANQDKLLIHKEFSYPNSNENIPVILRDLNHLPLPNDQKWLTQQPRIPEVFECDPSHCWNPLLFAEFQGLNLKEIESWQQRLIGIRKCHLMSNSTSTRTEFLCFDFYFPREQKDRDRKDKEQKEVVAHVAHVAYADATIINWNDKLFVLAKEFVSPNTTSDMLVALRALAAAENFALFEVTSIEPTFLAKRVTLNWRTLDRIFHVGSILRLTNNHRTWFLDLETFYIQPFTVDIQSFFQLANEDILYEDYTKNRFVKVQSNGKVIEYWVTI